MPVIGIPRTDAGEVRPGALAAPLEGVVVHALRRERVGTVALDLIAEGADLLAVADIAALPNVDASAREFERRVGSHAGHLLHRVLEREERRDLDQPAGGDDDQDGKGEADGATLEPAVQPGEARTGFCGCHGELLRRYRGAGRSQQRLSHRAPDVPRHDDGA